MTTAASPAAAVLGAPLAAFAAVLGPPFLESWTGLGRLCRFRHRGIPLTELFAQDRAVAVHGPYTFPTLRGIDAFCLPFSPAAFAQSDDPALLLYADTGWVVTTEACPPAVIALIAIA